METTSRHINNMDSHTNDNTHAVKHSLTHITVTPQIETLTVRCATNKTRVETFLPRKVQKGEGGT